MNRIFWFSTMVLLAVFAVAPFIVLPYYATPGTFFASVTEFFLSQPKSDIRSAHEVRIVGDVMLARHVETLMEQHGPEYPYHLIAPEPKVVWVGNFEGTVPDQHRKTPDYALNFSVNARYLEPLRDFGFTHLSLANNHSFDFGEQVYAETLDNLYEFDTFGHPKMVNEESISFVALGEKKIGIVAINQAGESVDWAEVKALLYSLNLETDVQIAYIHWGEEYALTHNQTQKQLAYALIDDGIDMVIGHHPHVVQDIEMYEGKPIFYSLGNFIFDQYFDESVKQGLVVALKDNGDELTWDLLPVSTEFAQAAPEILYGERREVFLTELAKRSDPSLFLDILDGSLTLAH